MTSKERVLTAFASREPDRVPVDYGANPGIDGRLKKHFGLKPDDTEGLRLALGVDFRSVRAPYRGPKLHQDIPDRGVRADEWGNHTRLVKHDTGGYWDFCDFPLRDADEETIANWPMPSPDDYDYSAIADVCRTHGRYAICQSLCGGGITNGNGMLRGMEQSLIDLITDDPAGLLLADRRMAIQLEVASRTLEAVSGLVDIIFLAEDLGTQIGPIFSREVFHKHIRPRHQKFCDLAKAHDVLVMVHSCGSSSWAYEDFIEMGIHAIDTLQPEAKDMSPRYLKKTFGGRLAFHGCISTAGPVAVGSVDDVVADCRNVLDIMMPGGGYCFAPAHALQDNSPTENVVAMYDAAAKYGVY